ncbi:N-acetyltransferase Ecym_2483 [Eremothecium cymbalariae DBVPG|uniref:Condensation domain-containing protein n=1 Tax=Eremothecium cymbalariae (strain CBS 270.75 / DBVPG 7215 / KCTC 17166 / NRRL Y-17582) TaxID=931890 RepID=G8JPU8_ERECY|nr:Hypothetical protein Ecym_2483 [Eremothecium cymbalariae DBVPG\
MRVLNTLEEYFYYKKVHGFTTFFYVGVTFNKPVDRSSLCCVLKELIPKHPHLYRNIFTKDGSKKLVRPLNVEIRLDDVLEETGFDSLDESAANSILKNSTFQYDQQRPLWKLISLKAGTQFLFCFDHAFFDGMSAVIFWNDFISALNSIKPENRRGMDLNEVLYKAAADPEIRVHPFDLWPIPWVWSMKRAVTKIWTYYAGQSIPQCISLKGIISKREVFRFKHYIFPSGFFNSEGVLRNDNVQLSSRIPPDKMDAILVECRKHKVSFTSWFAAKLIQLLRELDPNESTGSIVKIMLPVDCRAEIAEKLPSYPADELKMGLFVKNASLHYDLDSPDINEFWQIASSIHTQIVQGRLSDASIQSLKLLDFLDISQYVLEGPKSPPPSSTFEITNLGLHKFDGNVEEPEFYAVDAVFNEPQTLSAAFTCALISTPLGGLHASISVPKAISNSLTKILLRSLSV